MGPMERLADKLIVLACCLAVVAQGPVDTAQVAWAWAAVGASALAEALRGRQALLGAPGRQSAAVILNAPQVVGAVYLVAAFAAAPAAAFAPLACYDAARGPVPAYGGVAALAAAFGAAAHCQAGRMPWPLAAQLALFALVAALLSRRSGQNEATRLANRRARDSLKERALSLEAKNRDLLERQEYEVELAALSERARIARDIHDNVGHLLTRATLQVEALRIVHADEPGVERDFAGVGATLAEALDMVRASVHNLHDDSIDLGVQMRQAAESAAAHSTLEVRVSVETGHVPAPISACLLAVEREALSNALRHGNARTVSVRCVEHPAFWQLSVVDDGDVDGTGRGASQAGSGAAGTAPGVPASANHAAPGARAGMGLASMRERVEALGGTFLAGPQAEGGWRVFASIPRGGAAHTPKGGPA